MLGAGEWVMQNRNIKVKDYAVLKETFYPAQLTELLTNYGEIMSIWFDGHWDQTNSSVATRLFNMNYHHLDPFHNGKIQFENIDSL